GDSRVLAGRVHRRPQLTKSASLRRRKLGSLAKSCCSQPTWPDRGAGLNPSQIPNIVPPTHAAIIRLATLTPVRNMTSMRLSRRGHGTVTMVDEQRGVADGASPGT